MVGLAASVCDAHAMLKRKVACNTRATGACPGDAFECLSHLIVPLGTLGDARAIECHPLSHPIQILRANSTVSMKSAAPDKPTMPIMTGFIRNPNCARMIKMGNESRLKRPIETNPDGPPLREKYGSNRTPKANSVSEVGNRKEPAMMAVMNRSVNQLSHPHGFQSSRIIRENGSNANAEMNRAPMVVPR